MIELKYPKINFWDEEAKQIRFINEGDFQKGKLLKVMGLSDCPLTSSFGAVSGQEIRKRQALVKFFVENPGLVGFLNNLELRGIYLPTNAQSFLDYFLSGNNHCPFCELVHKVIEAFTEFEKIPSEIFSFVKFFENTREEIEVVEKEMVDAISLEVQKALYIEGTVGFRVSNYGTAQYEEEKEETYGYQKYIPNVSQRTVPKWLRDHSNRLANVIEKIVDNRNKKASKKIYSSYLVEKIPGSIKSAICNYVEEGLRNSVERNGLQKDLAFGDYLFLKFFFRYASNGLEIRIIDIDIKTSSKEENEENKIFDESFIGYTPKQIDEIRKKNQQFNKKVRKLEESLRLLEATKTINKGFPGAFNSLVKVKSPEADLEFKWCLVKNLYTIKFKEHFSLLDKYRSYFHSCLDTLTKIAKLAQTFVTLSKKWNKPLCFPRILGNKHHLVSFESLDPIHLIGEVHPTNLVSIVSLPSLNGQAIGFTGQNAGGKSVAEESITNAVYLAQSGLPVFGKGFALNPKRRIGLIFMERGKGSTAELLLRKGKRILEELQKDDKNGTLLIVDEVGSATQHLDGTDYGRRFLKKLSQSGCSILFSTQISEVAEYAQKELDAQCFAFDLNHRITPGIGSGGLEKLMDRMGMTELLKESNSN